MFCVQETFRENASPNRTESAIYVSYPARRSWRLAMRTPACGTRSWRPGRLLDWREGTMEPALAPRPYRELADPR